MICVYAFRRTSELFMVCVDLCVCKNVHVLVVYLNVSVCTKLHVPEDQSGEQ